MSLTQPATLPMPLEPLGRANDEHSAVFRALFESSVEGLLVCDARGTVRACNTLAARLIGAGAGRVVGTRVTQWVAQAHLRAGDGFALRGGVATLGAAACDERTVEIRVTPVGGGEDQQWIVHLHDTTDHQRTKDKLAFLANFDGLTGLANRTHFRERLIRAMGRARHGRRALALMFLDLDRFKFVNDTMGHEVGDRLLRHVARLLSTCLGEVDTIDVDTLEERLTLARLGGDEFTVIAEDVGNTTEAASIARRMLEALQEPFNAGMEEVVVSASIGISMYAGDAVDMETLIRQADMAMYRAKSQGRGTFSFYSEDLHAASSARVSLEGNLRRAIERGEFELHYQPKADLRSGRIVGVEALIRWQRAGHGMVPPDEFIGVLEDTGMILQVGAWVIRAACAQLAEWDRAGLPPMRMAVNLSARQLRHQYLSSLVEDSLREHYIDPRRFEIELTESLLMEDTDASRAVLASFRRIGVGLAIDDFGTGHSSLHYLKRFNVDTLKIDKSFVRSLPDSNEDCAIARAVVALGRSMQMRVVAEGVESEAQADALAAMGCDEIQGYLLSRPLAGPEFALWLEDYLEVRRAEQSSFGPVRDTGPITLLSMDLVDE
ncbi:MAG TPA: EAL domain-containing protein [Burkholderiaceae bacterium]|nr:EAL domain-containing protein [Burkholderiaceae bacterium]